MSKLSRHCESLKNQLKTTCKVLGVANIQICFVVKQRNLRQCRRRASVNPILLLQSMLHRSSSGSPPTRCCSREEVWCLIAKWEEALDQTLCGKRVAYHSLLDTGRWNN